MNIQKKLSLTAALTLLLALMLTVLPISALAEAPVEEANRFNVVLVVDKSGSLCDINGHGTDPDGLRFDALRMFLGLLTESGNNVGSVVFDEQIRHVSELMPVDSMADKKEIIRQIEAFTPSYDTDIGSAVLRATELLAGMKEKNDLPCMIILFSDGMTDFKSGSNDDAQKWSSYGKAQQALDAARAQGISINGIHLNVKDSAKDGTIEFQLYTHGTNGAFEEVTRPEDLAAAFRRIYKIVNNTDYTGAQRVSFSKQGEAEIIFSVPNFGVEEVNVIVEGEDLRSKDGVQSVDIDIISPKGEHFDFTDHELDSSRYHLVKIPSPDLGIWNVRLKGEPENWVDVTMVCNASLRVMLNNETPADPYLINTPYRFSATVIDPAQQKLTEEQIGSLKAVLTREELSTGNVREYEMTYTDGVFVPVENVSFPRVGVYTLTASVGLGDFKVYSDPLTFGAVKAPLVPQVSEITDMLRYGQFHDGVWELKLDPLFGADKDSEISYAISDDHSGILTLKDGVLSARLSNADPVPFTLAATDPMDQHAEIAFRITAPPVTAKVGIIADILELGTFRDSRWEAELTELFNDPKDGELTYELSNNRSGAAVIEGGVLRVDMPDGSLPVSFNLTATDQTQQSAKIAFEISLPVVTTKVQQVTNMMRLGRLNDFVWELPMEGLFYDSKDLPLTYTLSDDLGGAVTLEDNIAHVDFHELRKAEFSVTATNPVGSQATIPFKLTVPGPSASVGGITETVKTGLFQEDVWTREIGALFSDPKGTAMSYTLSDDFAGAAKIDSGALSVNMKGLKKASFTIKATDEYNLSSEIPITLTEKNMTLVYLLWALLILLGVGGIAAGVVFYLRRR